MTSDQLPHFNPGDHVVLRYVTRFDGGVGMSWPYTVVQDTPDLLALYIPTGATYMQWSTPPATGRRELVEARWRRDVLRLMFPGEAYSVWLFWEGEPRQFTTYYVNFEEPFRRTPIGFDTNDHTLDIMVAPDFSWHWKDREDFEALIVNGHFSPEFGDELRANADRVVETIEARSGPFAAGWETWLPRTEWATPTLHPRWREEPATHWPRREWAYPMTRRS